MTTIRTKYCVCQGFKIVASIHEENKCSAAVTQYTLCIFSFYQICLADYHNIVNFVMSTYTYLTSQDLHVPGNNSFYQF